MISGISSRMLCLHLQIHSSWETHKKKEVKAKWVILDVMKDHFISHLSKKKTMKEMFDALVNLPK
jgi:hypothetical protein